MIGGVIYAEKRQAGVTNTLHYLFDENGTRIGFVHNGTDAYYYRFNLQGDVTGIYNASGTLITEYFYDAWGKLENTTGNYFIGLLNPIRYRGYYFDMETGLYYLNSRYYDPETGRFINADGFVSTGQGILSCNMFAYCGNNPVNRADPTGCCYGYANRPNLDSAFSGVKFGINCGAYGAHARRPRVADPFVTDEGYSSSGTLTNEQMHANADIIYDILSKRGWSKNAICAVLGNMHQESKTINPGCWQDGGGGYGIVQWDPASKYLDWAAANGYSATSLKGQIEYLTYSMRPGQGEWLRPQNQYRNYYLSRTDFISSTASVGYLTQVFMYSYERPGTPHLDTRLANAQYWYDYYSQKG